MSRPIRNNRSAHADLAKLVERVSRDLQKIQKAYPDLMQSLPDRTEFAASDDYLEKGVHAFDSLLVARNQLGDLLSEMSSNFQKITKAPDDLAMEAMGLSAVIGIEYFELNSSYENLVKQVDGVEKVMRDDRDLRDLSFPLSMEKAEVLVRAIEKLEDESVLNQAEREVFRYLKQNVAELYKWQDDKRRSSRPN